MHVNAAEREAVALPNILQYCWTPSTALNAVMILSTIWKVCVIHNSLLLFNITLIPHLLPLGIVLKAVFNA